MIRPEPATPDAVPLGTPAPETADAMTVVVRTAIRIALPLLGVAGLYLVAWGYSPGGGFPAGAVLVGVLLLVYAGFGRRRVAAIVRPGLLEAIELAGATAIIVTELLGLVLRGSVSANWLPLAAAADHPVGRDSSAVLRQRAGRGGHRAGHHHLRADRHGP